MNSAEVRPIPGVPQTVNALFAERARTNPDHVLLVERGGRITLQQMDEMVGKWASALESRGVGRGDRVAVSMPNGIPVVLSFFATLRLGAVWVGINRVYAAPEKAHIIRDSGAMIYMTTSDIAATVEPLRETLPDLHTIVDVGADLFQAELIALPSLAPVEVSPFDLAGLAYTSGTTGQPKGAMHSHRNLIFPGVMTGRDVPPSKAGVYLPLTVLNLQVLGPLASLTNLGTTFCIDRADAEGIVEWIEEHGIDSMSAAPATFHDIVSKDSIRAERLESLVNLGLGGSAPPEWIFDAYFKKFGKRVTTGYGLSEAPSVVTKEPLEVPRRKGSAGKPHLHLKVTIVDDAGNEMPTGEPGEVVVSAATEGDFAHCYTPMLGYWNKPEATAKSLRGNRLFTGDIGYLDEEGHLHIEDRRVDLILRGGANVYPAEIERVLNADDRIVESAVVGKDDDRLGQLPVVFIQCLDGAKLDAETVQGICAAELAKYKVPVEVIFVDSFPRNHMGKILRPELRARING